MSAISSIFYFFNELNAQSSNYNKFNYLFYFDIIDVMSAHVIFSTYTL